MNEPDRVCFVERKGDIAQNMDDARHGLRPGGFDDVLKACAVEELHRVVEQTLGSAAVVVDRDGVRVLERRRELHFAPKEVVHLAAAELGPQELHRRGALEHAVGRVIDDAHRAFTELVLELVLAEASDAAHFAPQAMNDERRDARQTDGQRPPHGRHQGGRDDDGAPFETTGVVTDHAPHRGIDVAVVQGHHADERDADEETQHGGVSRRARHEDRAREEGKRERKRRDDIGANLRRNRHAHADVAHRGEQQAHRLGGDHRLERPRAAAADEPHRHARDDGRRVKPETRLAQLLVQRPRRQRDDEPKDQANRPRDRDAQAKGRDAALIERFGFGTREEGAGAGAHAFSLQRAGIGGNQHGEWAAVVAIELLRVDQEAAHPAKIRVGPEQERLRTKPGMRRPILARDVWHCGGDGFHDGSFPGRRRDVCLGGGASRLRMRRGRGAY